MIDDILTIKRIANNLNVYNIEYYKGTYGAGIIVKIKNEVGSFNRLIQFSTEQEVTKFLTLYNYVSYNSDITLVCEDYYQNLVPKSYKFLKDNQEYTYEMYKEEEKLRKEKNQKRKQEEEQNKVELQRYIDEKYSKIFVPYKQVNEVGEKIEKAKKILEQLKNNEQVDLSGIENLKINENKKEYTDIFVNDFIYAETNKFTIEERVIYANNINKLKIILEQIDYLSHLSKLKRIFNKKEIQERLNTISKSYKILNPNEIKEVIEQENKYYEYLYKKIGKLSYKNITFVKELDKIPDFEERIKLIDKYVDEQDEKKRIELQKELEIKKLHSNKKEYNIYKELSRQYEENFTEEEKNALLIYNSAAFAIINEVGSIPDYEKMSLNQIKTIINSERYLDRNNIVKFAIDKIFEQSKYRENALSRMLNDFVTGDYIKNSVDILKIISNIKSKLFLPCDLTVYRAVTTEANTQIEKLSYGKLMSTTLNPNASSKYYGNGQKTLIKINLKAGTPVTAVFPKTVNYSFDWGYNLAEDCEKTTPIYELLFDMDDYIVNYENAKRDYIMDFRLNNDGEFVYCGVHYIYETTMTYKNVPTLNAIETETKSR